MTCYCNMNARLLPAEVRAEGIPQAADVAEMPASSARPQDLRPGHGRSGCDPPATPRSVFLGPDPENLAGRCLKSCQGHPDREKARRRRKLF